MEISYAGDCVPWCQRLAWHPLRLKDELKILGSKENLDNLASSVPPRHHLIDLVRVQWLFVTRDLPKRASKSIKSIVLDMAKWSVHVYVLTIGCIYMDFQPM